MLKLGEKIISDIYLGDKKIAKVFLGDKLVYQANKPIFLDYVEFDGASYIDAGVVPVFGDKLEIYGQLIPLDGNTTYYALFSAGTGSYQLIFLPTSAKQCYYKYFETGGARDFRSPLNEKLSFYECFADGSINKDGTQILAPNEALTAQTVNTNLFIGGRANKTSYWIGKIGNAKLIASDGTVRFDLRPCLDPKGVVCFYDMVTKKYFYNQGAGTLTAGNVIKFVDYIHTDGNSYIDTGIIGKSGLRVVYDVYISNASDNSVRHITGCRNTSGETRFYLPAIRNGCWDVAIRSDDTTGLAVESDKIYHIDIDTSITPTTLTIDGVVVSSNSNTITTTYPMYLFAVNNYGTATMRNNAGMRIYDYKCYEGETLLIHLRPCAVAGEAGFYDMVTGNIFTNAGTGTLKASGRFVESIVFDGASYIDTGILHADGRDGTWTVKGKANMDGVFRVLLANQAVGGSYYGKGSNDKWGLGSTYYFDVNADVLKEAQVVFKKDRIQATMDGVTLTRTNTQVTYTIKLGGTNLEADLNNYFIGEAHRCKYVDINNNLIIDLRPYVDENGTACFKDIVTGKLFYNQGTGKLEYTE